MKPRLRVVLLGAFLGILTGRGIVYAQFDNPSRAFHNLTSFRLEGRHQTVACESCHLRGVYKGTPNTCFACHWVRRQDDRYALRLGSQCEQCHRPTAWAAVRWNHAATTGVVLNTAHRTLGCDTCHRGGNFRATSVTCSSCHLKDYQATQSPNHTAAGFPTTCETCHKASDETFDQATFDHNATFPLIGAHPTLACAACHRGNVYKGAPRDCFGCHRAAYERAQNPNHVVAGFPTTCETCHRPTDPTWRGASAAGFNHDAFFPLVGQHTMQTCQACHRNNIYKGTPRDCVGCHRLQYERTTSPNHVQAGFPTTCEQCHRATDPSWRGASFNHSQFFPLLGVHAQQTCATCHRNNVYKGTARECVGCHRDKYDRTTSPNHVQAGFPTACEQCHRATDASWRGASFNHSQFFPLLGLHAQQTCTTCHRNNVYRGTPRDCVGCHRAKYDQTSRPNHAGTGFSTACASCHRATDTAWTQGTYTHIRWLVTGSHRRTCAECHLNPANYREFSCTVCHERGETDKDHRGINGYRYDSLVCLTCHPTGRKP